MATQNEKKINKKNKTLIEKDNILYGFKGELKSLKAWCMSLKISYKKTHYRINKLKWEFEEAIYPIERELIYYDGVTKTLLDWCILFDLETTVTCLKVLRGEKFENLVLE